jgi:hypothetical protein
VTRDADIPKPNRSCFVVLDPHESLCVPVCGFG